MFYHKIKYDDQLNGEGLRVVLFVSGCCHHCDGCHNPETWSCNSGVPFDEKAEEIIFNYLEKDYIDGITFSGGDPLHPNNCTEVFLLMDKIKKKFPDKTIWLYTGKEINVDDFGFVALMGNGVVKGHILGLCDYIVDGAFIKEQRDLTLAFRGSTNQRIIDVKETLKNKEITLIKE